MGARPFYEPGDRRDYRGNAECAIDLLTSGTSAFHGIAGAIGGFGAFGNIRSTGNRGNFGKLERPGGSRERLRSHIGLNGADAAPSVDRLWQNGEPGLLESVYEDALFWEFEQRKDAMAQRRGEPTGEFLASSRPCAFALNESRGHSELVGIEESIRKAPASHNQLLPKLGLPPLPKFERINIVYTPKHGSWLNVAECELNRLTSQCLKDRRIGEIETLQTEIAAWSTRCQSKATCRRLAIHHRQSEGKIEAALPENIVWTGH